MEIKIDSILGGISSSEYFSRPDEFLGSIGIDPALPVDDTTTYRPSGLLRPTAMEKFSGSSVTNTPLWMITNPKDSNCYVYCKNGNINTVSNNLSMGTAITNSITFTVTVASPAVFTSNSHGLTAGDIIYFTTTGALPTGLSVNTPYYVISGGLSANDFEVSATLGGTAINTSGTQSGTHKFTLGSGNGAAYYDNYIYFARNRDIGRYGPLDGSPTFTEHYWGTTLSKGVLTDTTYPNIGPYEAVRLPNHIMHRHVDNKLYIADVVGNKGVLHYIKTSKTTAEGDTNDGSAASVIDFGYGKYITAIESYGSYLLVALCEGSSSSFFKTNQKPAKLALWDTVSASFEDVTPDNFSDTYITAMKNVNGTIYVFSSIFSIGCRISRFNGVNSLEEIYHFKTGYSPLPGAVDNYVNRLIFGTYNFDNNTAITASVYALGSTDVNLPMGLHNILTYSGGAEAGIAKTAQITCLKYFKENSSGTAFEPIIGWKEYSYPDYTQNTYGLDKLSTTYITSNYWCSQKFKIGKHFQLQDITIPLIQAVANGMTLIVKAVIDGGSAVTLCTIDTTDYPYSQKRIKKSLAGIPSTKGYNNFYIQLKWSGSALLTVALPIIINISTSND